MPKTNETIEAMVRDFTQVQPRSKSEARERILKILAIKDAECEERVKTAYATGFKKCMKTFNEVIEEEKKAFWAKNGNPDSLSSISQFHPDIQGRLPQVIDEAIAQAMKKAALAAVDQTEELAWDYIVTATREESWSRIDLKQWFATLRKQLTDKE